MRYDSRPIWLSRAPEPSELAYYRETLASEVPDSKSKDLLGALFALSRVVSSFRKVNDHRIGEEYTKVQGL
jgi:hypothetical protein